MQFTLQYAEKHFADIVSAVNRGEDVEIAQPEKPAIKLFLVAECKDAATQDAKLSGRKHLLGAWAGKVVLPTDEEWRTMDEEIASEMLNGAIFPPERA